MNEKLLIKVQVYAGSRKERIVCDQSGRYEVYVRERAEKNAANARARHILAQTLDVPVSAVRLAAGHHKRCKIFCVLK